MSKFYGETLHVFATLQDLELRGELSLKGQETYVQFFSEAPLPILPKEIYCRDQTGRHITLLDCLTIESGRRGGIDTPIFYAKAFPHLATIGDLSVSPSDTKFKSVYCELSDWKSLFWDYRPWRDLPHSDLKMIDPKTPVGAIGAAFMGDSEVFNSQTPIGAISAHHSPTTTMAGPHGYSAENSIPLCIEPSTPCNTKEAIEFLNRFRQFAEMCSGRTISFNSITLWADIENDEYPSVELLISHEGATSDLDDDQHGMDLLAGPCIDRPEYEKLVKNWFSVTDISKLRAVVRFSDNLRKGRQYSQERLVNAASCYEWYVKAEKISLDSQIHELLKEAKKAIKKLPESSARNSALSSLGNIGSESLTQKIVRYLEPTTKQLENTKGLSLNDINGQLKSAVKCRNFLVHGGTDTIIEELIDDKLVFLTDTLEVMFALACFQELGLDLEARLKNTWHAGTKYFNYLKFYNLNV